MSFRRDDVILVLFPDSNLRTSRRRPALVVEADALDGNMPRSTTRKLTRLIGHLTEKGEIDAALRGALAP